MKKHSQILRMILTALFLALAYVLPFLTFQNQKLGSMFSLMHIPVLLCGFICGWPWGLAVGLIAPLLRSLTLGMPILFPMAFCMALELATYGAVAGLMHKFLPRKKPFIFCSLLAAMATGRVVFGCAMFLCMSAKGGSYTFMTFLNGALIDAVPGIILQIVLIPAWVMAIEDTPVFKSLRK